MFTGQKVNGWKEPIVLVENDSSFESEASIVFVLLRMRNAMKHHHLVLFCECVAIAI